MVALYFLESPFVQTVKSQSDGFARIFIFLAFFATLVMHAETAFAGGQYDAAICGSTTSCPNSYRNRSVPRTPYRNSLSPEYVAEQRAAQLQKRQEEAARVTAMPEAGPVWTKRLEAAVETDSKGWMMNHFDRGSVHDVRIADGDAAAGNVMVRGEYTYDGGDGGWVLARYTNGKLSCVQFWNGGSGCRDLRTPEDARRVHEVQASIAESLTRPATPVAVEEETPSQRKARAVAECWKRMGVSGQNYCQFAN